MNALEWLQSPGMTLEEGKAERTILEELAQLVGVNGGMAWKGFGAMTHGGPYGRLGVSLEEAVRLVYLSGVLDGLTKADGGQYIKEVTQAIKDQIRKDAEARAPKIVGTDGRPLGT